MFHAYENALDVLRYLPPVIARIKKHDRDLANQMQRAATSMVLNVGEGAGRTGGDRRRHYEFAYGSAKEVVAVLDTARVWGWLGDTRELDDKLRREQALLWGLLKGAFSGSAPRADQTTDR